MAVSDKRFERIVQLSVLDRLIDDEPENRNEKMMTRVESLRLLRASVKRDLEFLLNATRMPIDIPESCPEVKKSVLVYGLPDITTISIQNIGDEQRLIRSLESAIEQFEPRLACAKVTTRAELGVSKHAVTFRVEAMLMIDPAPERIAFDTVLEISKGAYTVKES